MAATQVSDGALALVITAAVAFVGLVLGLIRFGYWLSGRLENLARQATPNGLNTLDAGDTAARSETKLDELRGLVLWHISHHPGPSEIPSVAVGRPPPLPTTLTPTREEIEVACKVEDHAS